MSMHWGAEFLSSILPADKIDRLHEIDTDPYHDSSKDAGYVQCNGETAEVLVVMKSSTPKRVSRARFRRLLSDGLNIEVGNHYPWKIAHRIRDGEIRSCAWTLIFSTVREGITGCYHGPRAQHSHGRISRRNSSTGKVANRV